MLSYHLVCNYWVYYVVFIEFLYLSYLKNLIPVFQKDDIFILMATCINTFSNVLTYSLPWLQRYRVTLIYHLHNNQWFYSKFSLSPPRSLFHCILSALLEHIMFTLYSSTYDTTLVVDHRFRSTPKSMKYLPSVPL